MKRLFFALWPDDKVRKSLVRLNHSITSENLVKVTPDNLHVTLVFLGNISVESEVFIRKSVENINIKSFVLNFDRLSYWRKPRVLCLTTQKYDAQLSFLVAELKSRVEQFNNKIDERPYKPHITLARKAQKMIEIDDLLIKWPATSFCLVESCSTTVGVNYHVVQSWNFN